MLVNAPEGIEPIVGVRALMTLRITSPRPSVIMVLMAATAHYGWDLDHG